MTGSRKTGLGGIGMKRGPISLDIDCNRVVHIPGNHIGTETVRTREGFDEIGTGLPPGKRGNTEAVHILRKTK